MPPHARRGGAAPGIGRAGRRAPRSDVYQPRRSSPENVLISDEGEVKIADFGLVRAVRRGRKSLPPASFSAPPPTCRPNRSATETPALRSDVLRRGGSWPMSLLNQEQTPFPRRQRHCRSHINVWTLIVPAPRQRDQRRSHAPFDDAWSSARTARDPADRYADAQGHGRAELGAIVDELRLFPTFGCHSPRNFGSAPLSCDAPAATSTNTQHHRATPVAARPRAGCIIRRVS